MSLPPTLVLALQQAMQHVDDVNQFESLGSVGGGCINNAQHLRSGQREYFLKFNANPLPNMFSAEADGLQRMGAVGAIRVPQVYAYGEVQGSTPAFILMEWIHSDCSMDQAACGEQLAQLHLQGGAERYGLDNDNYIGSNVQYNNWDADWVRFFREKRLQPQMQLAAKHGHLPKTRRERLERFMDRLEDWLAAVPRKPSLLHGDLWGGNAIAGPGGQPVLIDPAVYYGDREAELAFTRMFGGFTDAFYEAYKATAPLEPGYQQRFEIYNLYHLLNHLNLFGESYGARVDAILRHFVG